jgi:3-deoxy-D-manno-octulosonate 8-phosphate phosphatase (KDO 8-P phosphatase)
VAIVSGRPVDIARQRFRELGVDPFIGNCRDKSRGAQQVCDAWGVDPAACAFIGDDLPDLAGFARCGLRIAVGDAAAELLAEADWITRAAGGQGAVREVCEAILKHRGEWDALVTKLKR